MRKKSVLLLMLIILGAIGIFQFIRINNDHAECEVKVEHSKDVKGNTVISKQHVCLERFPI